MKIEGNRLWKWIRLPHVPARLKSAVVLTAPHLTCRYSHSQCQMAANGPQEDGAPQYGTQENPTRVTGQFLNGRGPDEVSNCATSRYLAVHLSARASSRLLLH